MIKVVIVDDHQMFIDGLVSVLSRQDNIQILFTENNAKIALKRLNRRQPHLIISDISMPEMNGLEFIKILNADFPKIKILVISMFKNIQNIDDIDGFLLKETSSEDLIKAVNGIVLRNEKHFANNINEITAFEFNNPHVLGQKEKEIIKLIAAEFTTDEIADKLGVSKYTVETHRKNIFIKLHVKNIAGLVRMAVHLGIVD